MTSDKAVVIDVGLNVSDIDKEVARLKSKIMRLEETGTFQKTRKNMLVESLRNAQEELGKLQKKTEVINGRLVAPPGVLEDINRLKNQIPEIETEIQKCDKAINDGNLKMDAAKRRIGDLIDMSKELADTQMAENQNAEAEIKEPPVLVDAMEKARARMEQTKAVFAELLQQGFPSPREAITNFTNLLCQGLFQAGKKATSAFGNALQGIPNAIKATFSAGVKAVTAFGKCVMNVASHLNVFSNIAKSIGPAIKRLGSMIKRVFVFSVISSGLQYLRTRVSLYLQTNSELMSALSQVKDAFLTAFQPIYDAVVPALVTLLNFLTSVISAIAQFTAMLFGSTAKQAKSGAKALNEEAKALNATGSAAEDAAQSLAGFDEIQTLQTENAGGGSGGAEDSVSFPDMDDAVFPSWGEAFNAFLNGIINEGIPRLQEAFAGFSGWLNSLSADLYRMFTFDGVKDKVIRIGKDLADAFNDLVGDIKWRNLGQTIGSGIDLLLQGAVNFIYTFDWSNLGNSIADAIDGVVSAIDWKAVGQWLWAGWKIGIETLAGFVAGADMTQWAQTASDMAIGFCDSITETITNIDWAQLAHQIMTFLVSMDWAGVVESVSEAISAAFGAFGSFIGQIFNDAFESVSDYFDYWIELTEEMGGNWVEGILVGILAAVFDIAVWIWENVFQPFIDGFCEAFGIHSPSTVMEEQGGYIIAGLFNGITRNMQPILDIFTSLNETIKTILDGIVQFISGVFTADWQSAWNGVQDIFKVIWNGVIGVLEGAVNLIIDGINFMISQLNRLSIQVPDFLGGGTFGFNVPTFANVSIPRLAQGAVIPPNSEFMAVLGDQRHGTNLEAPEDLIRQIVREESGNSEVIALLQAILEATEKRQKMYVNGRVLAETAKDGINDMTRAAGKPVLLY